MAKKTVEKMILIPGRSKKQGTSLNEGKLKQNYQDINLWIIY